jgi:DnaJ-class molecular chaperone
VKDPYQTLGVERTATQDEIRKAYRRLAKKLHPDINPGDKAGEARFKDVSAAYDLLSNEDKRRRFDAGEIDASGAERPSQRYYRDFAGSRAGAPYESHAGFADFASADDLFADLFRRSRLSRGADLQFQLAIDFLDAINGATKQVTLPNGSSLSVSIPAGVEEGQVLRLREKGEDPGNGAKPGDALIRVLVRPHKHFTRAGDDIRLDLPVTIKEAALGAKIRTPTPTGSVMLNVPKGANTGTILRLKGKGVQREGAHGDQLVRLVVMLPDPGDPDLEAFLTDWTPKHDPRKGIDR